MTCTGRFVSGMIALVAVGMVPVFAAGQPAFEGVYIARGVDSDGKEYRRAVNIERDGDQFAVTWVASRVVGEAIVLEPFWVGVGIAIGDTLSVSFVAGDTFGIVVYQAGNDGRALSGRWAVVDDDGVVHSETLTRLPNLVPDPATVDPSVDRGILRRRFRLTPARYQSGACQLPTSNFQFASNRSAFASWEVKVGR